MAENLGSKGYEILSMSFGGDLSDPVSYEISHTLERLILRSNNTVFPKYRPIIGEDCSATITYRGPDYIAKDTTGNLTVVLRTVSGTKSITVGPFCVAEISNSGGGDTQSMVNTVVRLVLEGDSGDFVYTVS